MKKDLKVELTITTWGLVQTLLHTYIANTKETLKGGATVYNAAYIADCKRGIGDAEAALKELADASRVDDK